MVGRDRDYLLFRQGVATGMGLAIGHITASMHLNDREAKIVGEYVRLKTTEEQIQEAWEHEKKRRSEAGE